MEGNRRPDALAVPVPLVGRLNIFQQAKLSHQQFHQNVLGLVCQFHLRRDQAKAIIDTCPNCRKFSLPWLGSGVNPRGLSICEVWQTDVTQIPQFGKFKYVHVSVDTFSGAFYASAHTEEKTTDAQKHLVQAFSTLVIPKVIKTDNGPTYASKEFGNFLQEWRVEQRKGIPYSPTGQAVIKTTHQTSKKTLEQHRGDARINSPHQRLCKALFTMNFLNCSFENLNPPVVRHFKKSHQLTFEEKPPVLVKDRKTWKVQEPFDLVTWGQGWKWFGSFSLGGSSHNRMMKCVMSLVSFNGPLTEDIPMGVVEE
ncbi:hypothetical protein HGM15179_020914 [Zosterops borbonicus]|uniref:RNA-directed DNA polymerase n=1 Tax=Zosterops borbonicus TaxID=364589 RepID=A0A8K1D8B8_9PASS|nr:hypothetical protein HGM15179_020914 [Zosterops borbonicus]